MISKIAPVRTNTKLMEREILSLLSLPLVDAVLSLTLARVKPASMHPMTMAIEHIDEFLYKSALIIYISRLIRK